VRCPGCGAHNPDSAAWCSQCYARFEVDDAASAPAPAPAEPEPQVAADAPVPADASARDVRTVGGEVEWRCARCDGWNPLFVDRCTTCGGRREGFGEPAAPPEPATRDAGRLTLASAVLPGLGHVLAGRVGTGVARMLLAVLWLAGGAAIVAGAAGSAASAAPAAPLLLGAAAVWVGSVLDVRTLATGTGRERLGARTMLWLTSAVVGALVVLVVVTAGFGGPPGAS
jgi:hypothetical protein